MNNKNYKIIELSEVSKAKAIENCIKEDVFKISEFLNERREDMLKRAYYLNLESLSINEALDNFILPGDYSIDEFKRIANNFDLDLNEEMKIQIGSYGHNVDFRGSVSRLLGRGKEFVDYNMLSFIQQDINHNLNTLINNEVELIEDKHNSDKEFYSQPNFIITEADKSGLIFTETGTIKGVEEKELTNSLDKIIDEAQNKLSNYKEVTSSYKSKDLTR